MIGGVQAAEGEAGGFLLRLLLARPGRACERLPRHQHFHVEQLLMIGSDGPDDTVFGQGAVASLHQFLQRRLVILGRHALTA